MRTLLLLAVLSVAIRCEAPAQAPGSWVLTALAGPSSYDLSGVGTTFAAAVHFGWQWKRALVIEPGITYFHYEEQFGRQTTILFPELSVQAMVPGGLMRPYIGIGAGRSVVLQSPADHLSLHAVPGLRVPVGQAWGLRGELRVRSPHQWGAVTADYMFGLSRRLR